MPGIWHRLGLWFRDRAQIGVDLMTDGDMEAVGTAAWDSWGGQATPSKEGSPHTGLQCLRITAVAGGGPRFPNARQLAILQIGKRYRVRGWARSDGAYFPMVGDSARTYWAGDASTNWQLFDLTWTATGVDLWLFFFAGGPLGTEYVEFDDVTVYPV